MNQLGNLEELVLLLVLTADDEDSYGVLLAEKYKENTKKSISIPAVHTVLKRLEKKGLLESKLGEATAIRGGKRKRIYKITKYGYKVLREIQEGRESLWRLAPDSI